MTPTHPSSTPITAEGAVTILRTALADAIKCMETLDTIRHVATDFPALDNARKALSDTESAAIQPAGEPVGHFTLFNGRYLQSDPDCWPNGSEATVPLFRAPQDAKAEQVLSTLSDDAISAAMAEGNRHGVKSSVAARIVAAAFGRAPAASNVEAAPDQGQQGTLSIERIVKNAIMGNSHPTDEGYLMFLTEDEVATVARQVGLASRQSAPIEAGEMPYDEIADLISRNTRYEVEQDLIDLCRAVEMRVLGTARPASSVTSAPDDALRKELAGWMDEAAARQRMIDGLTAAANLRHQHDSKDFWYWQGDGSDHLESMSNGMAVLIRADHLRDLRATKPASTAPTARNVEAAMQNAMSADLMGWTEREKECFREGHQAGTARQSVAAPDARDAALSNEVIDALWKQACTEGGDTTQQFTRHFARAIIQAVQGKASDAEDAARIEWLFQYIPVGQLAEWTGAPLPDDPALRNLSKWGREVIDTARAQQQAYTPQKFVPGMNDIGGEE